MLMHVSNYTINSLFFTTLYVIILVLIYFNSLKYILSRLYAGAVAHVAEAGYCLYACR